MLQLLIFDMNIITTKRNVVVEKRDVVKMVSLLNIKMER